MTAETRSRTPTKIVATNSNSNSVLKLNTEVNKVEIKLSKCRDSIKLHVKHHELGKAETETYQTPEEFP